MPEPLTLEAALQAASNPAHFEIEMIDQKLDEADARILVEDSEQGISIDFRARVSRVGVSDVGDPDEDGDSAASLFLNKPLYTFGRAESRLSVLEARKKLLVLEKQLLVERRRQLIMEKYFDVLNADNEFISENENLAIGFIRFDRARDNRELGRTAEIEVLRLQSEYELIRQRRYEAQNNQRLTRMMLAESMGYPRHLPTTLSAPEIDLERPLSDNLDSLIERALETSSEARVLEARGRVAELLIQEADLVDAPRINLELEVSEYERDTSTRDDWRASVTFDIPLYSGQQHGQLALAQSRYRQALAEIDRFRSGLRLRVMELWQTVQQSRLIARGREITQSYRDIYLDRSRAEYDLEFRTDLGDAMVQYSRARTERLKAVYRYGLAYYQLQTLVGEDFIAGGQPQ